MDKYILYCENLLVKEQEVFSQSIFTAEDYESNAEK